MVLWGSVIVPNVWAAIMIGATWIGWFFRPLTRWLPQGAWWYFARQQPFRRTALLTTTAVVYLQIEVSWIPFRGATFAAFAAAIVYFVIGEIATGGARTHFGCGGRASTAVNVEPRPPMP